MTERTVLFVDDNSLNRKLMTDLLTAFACRVRCADSGAQALAIVAQAPPDLILLDIMMPEMDGFEVVRRLRSNAATRAIPIVMISALDDEGSRSRLATAGVDTMLIKPIDRWQLKAVLDRLLPAPE